MNESSFSIQKAAVIGMPVSHSLSPAIFAFLAWMEKLVFVYDTKEVLASDLGEYLKLLRADPEFVGVNVTIPHKESVLAALDQVSDEVKVMGAANVIQRKDGKLFGFNTDVVGIEKTFLSKGFSPAEQNCLIIGAGGAAKAVAYVLGKGKAASVVIYNPRSARGDGLATRFQATYPETKFISIDEPRALKEQPFGLIVNTTPVGMKRTAVHEDDPGFFTFIEALKFDRNALAFDLIYTPEETAFLKIAREHRLLTVGGLGMLIDQAIAAFEIWLKPLPDRERIRKELKLYLRGMLKLRENPAPIFLTGFMGAGKTTVGKELAKITGRLFIDTDQLIEEVVGENVQQIFALHGETQFRKYEKNAVREATRMKSSIVALGGGAVMDEANLEQILSNGYLVALDADEKTLAQRISAQGLERPLLQGLALHDRELKIKTLLETRTPIYKKANLSVSTVGLSPREVAYSILTRMGTLA